VAVVAAATESAVKTTVTELADSRVRLQVEVAPGELEGAWSARRASWDAS
jgi:hypothetical protein